ncbi:MAG: hypothetical protein ACLQVA_02275 [Candidatus Brocadiia bacterium]
MDGDISIPRNLQADRVVAPAAKRERGSGNPRRFEAQLSKERKSSEDPDHKAEAEEQPADAREETQPESTASPAAAADGGLLDFEA